MDLDRRDRHACWIVLVLVAVTLCFALYLQRSEPEHPRRRIRPLLERLGRAHLAVTSGEPQASSELATSLFVIRRWFSRKRLEPTLASGMSDEDPLVRRSVEYLNRLGFADDRIDLVAALEDPVPELRTAVCMGLLNHHAEVHELAPWIARSLATNTVDQELLPFLVGAIRHSGLKSWDVVGALVLRITDPGTAVEIRETAALALTWAVGEHLDLLVAGAREGSPVRDSAALALAQLRPTPPAAVAVLRAFLEDGRGRLLADVALGLAEGTVSAVDRATIRGVRVDLRDALVRSAVEGQEVRRTLARALAIAKIPPELTTPELLSLLEDSDPNVALLVRRALARGTRRTDLSEPNDGR